MISLHIQFEDFHPFALAQELIDLLLHLLAYLILQDAIAIFWTKHDMVFTLIQRVGEFSKPLAHLGSPCKCHLPGRSILLLLPVEPAMAPLPEVVVSFGINISFNLMVKVKRSASADWDQAL
jgi:hypothetical protein